MNHLRYNGEKIILKLYLSKTKNKVKSNAQKNYSSKSKNATNLKLYSSISTFSLLFTTSDDQRSNK